MTETGYAGARKVSEELTWQWYNAAETYLRYKVKGKDDIRIAVKYFRLAAEAGNAAAAYKVGEAYENGKGVALDPAQAWQWYRKASAAGDKYADVKIGYFYQKGIVVERNPAEAIRWYKMAQAKGNIWAYHMLGFMLADGEGTPQDVALAKNYFERSLPETNDAWAKWKLAHLVQETDPRRSVALLKQAADAGNEQAAAELKAAEGEQAPVSVRKRP
jgi:TPR repeat protein